MRKWRQVTLVYITVYHLHAHINRFVFNNIHYTEEYSGELSTQFGCLSSEDATLDYGLKPDADMER